MICNEPPAGSTALDGRGPLLTAETFRQLMLARRRGIASLECSLDLQRSVEATGIGADAFVWRGRPYVYPENCRERTIYHWTGRGFAAVARYGSSLVKLVPTAAGPPTFEIDGIKMLPTARESPYVDARRKVGLVRPRGRRVLDTCGGLGYFAAWCVQGGAAEVLSFEKNSDVIWLRSLNPWSPPADASLSLTHADVVEAIRALPKASVEAILHDPPRFGIAGELYSQDFYDQLSRVIKRRGLLFHYTGTPNKASSGRDLAGEVSNRLRRAGFQPAKHGDGVLAAKG